MNLFETQPWGEAAEDLRAARIGMYIAASAGSKNPRAEEIIPWLRRRRRRVTDWDAKERQLTTLMKLSGVQFVPVEKQE